MTILSTFTHIYVNPAVFVHTVKCNGVQSNIWFSLIYILWTEKKNHFCVP